jgi:ketosteroid isomerase-like protein
MSRRLALLGLAALSIAAPADARPSPRAALDELLSTERALSSAAATLSPADGIAAMLAPDAVLMTRGGPVRGRAAAAANLRDNPANQGAHAHWRSIRGGVSADGLHGFTLGYLDIDGGDPARAHRRYLAYWVRGAEGWRAATLKQVGRPAEEAEAAAQPPALPARIVAAKPARIAGHVRSLIAAEKAFSDRAQQVGIHQAFQENGRADAIHLFGPTGFAIGLAAIGANQPQGPTSPVSWSADEAIVASSGDLGVTIGRIRPNGPPQAGQPAEIPFFTIWRRDDPGQPWRYIAE